MLSYLRPFFKLRLVTSRLVLMKIVIVFLVSYASDGINKTILNNNFAGEGLDGICSLLTFFLKVKSNSANVYSMLVV